MPIILECMYLKKTEVDILLHEPEEKPMNTNWRVQQIPHSYLQLDVT